MKSRIISANTLNDLIKKINLFTNDGWILCSDISYIPEHKILNLTKETESKIPDEYAATIRPTDHVLIN